MPTPRPQVPVAAVLREPCPRPERPTALSVGALAAFSVRQEGALSVCEARKDAAVAILDAANAAAAPAPIQRRPWWRPF